MLVSKIVNSAMRKLNAVAAGEEITPEEQQDGLSALQTMLRSWSAEQINVFATVDETFVLTPPTYEYTWGVGGTINTARPHELLRATIDDSSGVTHRVDVIGEQRYSEISVKSTTGRPYTIFPKYEYPYVQLLLYPIPDTADTLNLYSLKPFTETSSFDSWEDTIQMPPHYEEAVIYNLAVRLAPEFGKTIKPSVAAIASSSYNRLIHKNAGNYIEPVRIQVPAGSQGGYSINSDSYR